MKMGPRNTLQVVIRSSHLQTPALGLLVLGSVNAQFGNSTPASALGRN